MHRRLPWSLAEVGPFGLHDHPIPTDKETLLGMDIALYELVEAFCVVGFVIYYYQSSEPSL